MGARQEPTGSYAWDPKVSKVINSICIQLKINLFAVIKQ